MTARARGSPHETVLDGTSGDFLIKHWCGPCKLYYMQNNCLSRFHPAHCPNSAGQIWLDPYLQRSWNEWVWFEVLLLFWGKHCFPY